MGKALVEERERSSWSIDLDLDYRSGGKVGSAAKEVQLEYSAKELS